MRMFVFLIAAIFAMCFSFYSSASGSGALATAAPQASTDQPSDAPRCSIKTTPNSGGCLVLKRKGRAA
ncbi:hypothetical protein V3H18_11640 [Methylocystis sp. 9N]|uniref:Uncharacterized protein n=1 Tax=Methylocystis borbori TaxID=3118750 RepID=A0ABU7XIH2_9HYPH